MSDDLIYILLKFTIALFSLLPRKILTFFSDVFGLVWYKIDKRHRDVAFKNCCFAYPEGFSPIQRQMFIKNVFKNTAGIIFESIWSHRKSGKVLFKYIIVKGLHHVKRAQRKGKGVILLSGHIGNFEFSAVAMAKVGVLPHGVYRKLDFPPLERLLLEIRQRFGAKMIPLRGASHKINDILSGNGIVGTLLDQNVDWYKGVFVDYFGRPACTNNGLAKLVLKSKAVVVPAFIIREKDNYILEFLPEIPFKQTGDIIKDIEINTQSYVTAIESMVKKCPEQYFWVHDRWKTKPYCTFPPV